MSTWLDVFYVFIIGATLSLSAMGLWFTAVIPGLDRWSKRFFLNYFSVFILCCIFSSLDMFCSYRSFPIAAVYIIVLLECLLLSLPLPMLTVYLLHCCGEDKRESRLMRAVLISWAAYALLLANSPFTGVFSRSASGGQYYRGPLYPLLLLPLLVILLLNVAGTVRRQARLSCKVYLSFLVAILPVMLALTMQVFVDVFPLIDIGYILSALSMYGLILSDQIEQDRRRRREIAHQRASVMVLQMRPHFIYNTLMSIYGLCNQDPQRARQVMKDFTDYLRKNFNAVASDSAIPFSAELEHTRAYLAVEQAQYDDMLIVEYDTPVIHFRLPPLTLQPLVENVVKHGINPYSGPLTVSVRTRKTDTGVEITVSDNGPGFDPNDDSKPHPTLDNIRQRLDMMCGGSMRITPRDGGGTEVKITIPYSAAE